ncbi:aspartic peptidase domain-containing protein, partial [Mycena leptocephala]
MSTGYGASNATSTLEAFPGRYATNVTVNGQNFVVVIDTGSSDFWISPPSDFAFDSTGVETSILYVAPSNVTGPISLGTVELGGYSFDKQAFVPAAAADVHLAGVLPEMDGLIGLAFDGTISSPITSSLVSAGFSATAGQPFLFNIFDQTPDVENFIAISLSRTGDLEGSADASFLINEFDETYSAIANSTPIPVFGNNRWNLPLDSIAVNGVALPIPESVVSSNPTRKLIVLMDSGTPTAFLPVELFNAIYGNIPGALFSASTGQFIIPCNTTAIVTVVLGGQSFPIHPLDLSDMTIIEEVTVCTSAFFPAPGNTDFDGLFGDAIMRNMYSVFNFGSAIAKAPGPSSNMQLLSQTDPTAAAADVLNVRMMKLASMPPEGVPPSFYPLTTVDLPQPAFDTALASSPTSNDEQVGKYAPIIIGLLGANLLILLILVVVGLVMCVKRSGKAAMPAYTPVRLREEAPTTSEDYEDKRYSDAYAPSYKTNL